MKDLKKTKHLVQRILEEDERARNSDSYLYFRVIKIIAERHSIDLRKIPVTDYILNLERSTLFPPFESVRRARQKVQAEFPYLAACERVRGHRNKNEAVYREFARAEG